MLAKRYVSIELLDNELRSTVKRCAHIHKVKSLSRVQLFATARAVAYQVPPSMEFSRQEYWSELPFGHHQNINMNTPIHTHTPPLHFLLPSAANLMS